MVDGFLALQLYRSKVLVHVNVNKAITDMRALVAASPDSGSPEFLRFKMHLMLFLINQHKLGSSKQEDYDVSTQHEILTIIANAVLVCIWYTKTALNTNALPAIEIQIHWQISIAFSPKIMNDERWTGSLNIGTLPWNAHYYGIIAALRAEESQYFVNSYTEDSMIECTSHMQRMLSAHFTQASTKYNKNERQVQALIDLYFDDLRIRMSPGLQYKRCRSDLLPTTQPPVDPGVCSNFPGISLWNRIKQKGPTRPVHTVRIPKTRPAARVRVIGLANVSTDIGNGQCSFAFVCRPHRKLPAERPGSSGSGPVVTNSEFPIWGVMASVGFVGVVAILVVKFVSAFVNTHKTTQTGPRKPTSNPFEINITHDALRNLDFSRLGEYKEYRMELVRTLKTHVYHIKRKHLASMIDKCARYIDYNPVGEDELTKQQQKCKRELVDLHKKAKEIEARLPRQS